MYLDTLPAALDCEQGEGLRQRSWSSGGYWPALGLGWTGLLSTLVQISITSYLEGNGTSLSGSRWSCAPVPVTWLLRPIQYVIRIADPLDWFQRQQPTRVPKTTAYKGSKDNSLQAVELSGHQTCKSLSSHHFKPVPRRFSGSESVCSG